MKYGRDALIGLALAVLTWVVLETTQAAWFGTISMSPLRAPHVEALGLLAAGAFIVVLVTRREVSGLSLLIAAGILLAALGPVALQFGVWGPDWFLRHVLQLGTFSGTWLTLGMLTAVAVVKLKGPPSRDRIRRTVHHGSRDDTGLI